MLKIGSTSKASIIGVVGLAAALFGPAGQTLASCTCNNVDPSEIVEHAESIALVRITNATIAKIDCGGLNESSCGIDVTATFEYFKGTGRSDFVGRITNTNPYFCGLSVKTGDELLEVEGEAPSLGSMTQICVLYETLNNRKLIDQFRDMARHRQSSKP